MRVHPSKNATPTQLRQRRRRQSAPTPFQSSRRCQPSLVRSAETPSASRLSSESKTGPRTRVAAGFPESSPSMGFCFPSRVHSITVTRSRLSARERRPLPSPQSDERVFCAGSHLPLARRLGRRLSGVGVVTSELITDPRGVFRVQRTSTSVSRVSRDHSASTVPKLAHG